MPNLNPSEKSSSSRAEYSKQYFENSKILLQQLELSSQKIEEILQKVHNIEAFQVLLTYLIVTGIFTRKNLDAVLAHKDQNSLRLALRKINSFGLLTRDIFEEIIVAQYLNNTVRRIVDQSMPDSLNDKFRDVNVGKTSQPKLPQYNLYSSATKPPSLTADFEDSLSDLECSSGDDSSDLLGDDYDSDSTASSHRL